jgi:hypothetical protein
MEVMDFGFRIYDFGYTIWDMGYGILDVGMRGNYFGDFIMQAALSGFLNDG